MLELKNNNAIISKTSQEISQEVGELIKIDIKIVYIQFQII